MANDKLKKAVEDAGGQAEFGRRVGAAPAMVYQWLTGRRPVSPRSALLIEAEFGISRHDLRADVFGHAPAEAEQGEEAA